MLEGQIKPLVEYHMMQTNWVLLGEVLLKKNANKLQHGCGNHMV